MLTMYDLGMGLLVFNPYDDASHLERITHCLQSLINAIHYTDKRVKLLVLMNQTVVGNPMLNGVGKQTELKVKELLKSSDAEYSLVAAQFPDSMNVASYHRLQQELHKRDGCHKVVVFADDYIIPYNWIETIFTEFRRYKYADFLTPSSVFIPQRDALVPLELKPKWKLVKREDRIVGIASGVSIEDVNSMARLHENKKTIMHLNANSFETTVFTDRFLELNGYVHPHYFSVYYNHEYFKRAKRNKAQGIISRRSFVFHYGKGGTASLYQKTGDEKYRGSPVEKFLMRDVDMYNKRNAKNADYFWKKPMNKKTKKISFSDINKEIERRIKKNNWRSLGYKVKLFFNIIYHLKRTRTLNGQSDRPSSCHPSAPD